jgi:hypothetical protein
MVRFHTVGFALRALAATPAPAGASTPERNVYFGTTHGHSSWSIDAFAIGNQKYAASTQWASL